MNIKKKELTELYFNNKYDIKKCAEICSITYDEMKEILIKKKLLISKKPWTEEELEYLQNNYGIISTDRIVKKLKRTKVAIIAKCNKEKICALNNSEYLTASELARTLGISVNTVYNWIKNKGLKVRKVIIRNKKRYIKINISYFWKWAKLNQNIIDFSNFNKNSLGLEPLWVEEKRKNDILYKNKKNKPYTIYEDNYIKRYYTLKSGKELAKDLNRSVRAVQARAFKLGIKSKVRLKWQPKEIKMLIRLKEKGYTDIEVAERLGRNVYSVRRKKATLMQNAK